MGAPPILLLIYNRPDFASRVVNKILELGCTKLYVAGDGPRDPRDRAAVELTRDAVISATREAALVKTLFRSENLGCKRAVESAISWFFEHEQEGIIIEDDCVPTASFIRFCELMLDRYRDDEQVMHISGYAHHAEQLDGYYFDRVPAVWGWATWSRAWRRYEPALPRIDAEIRSALRGGFASESELAYYARKFDAVASGRLDSWAFAWTYAVVTNHGLCVRPYKNFVQNIGIGDERATHTTRRWRTASASPLGVLEDDPPRPRFKVPDFDRERKFFRRSMRKRFYPIRLVVNTARETRRRVRVGGS